MTWLYFNLTSTSYLGSLIVDRRSVPSNWWVSHQNGKIVDQAESDFEQLYTAAWMNSKGEAVLYYPPLRVYGHPLGLGDVLGPAYESDETEFIKPNLPENSPQRLSSFSKPYTDVAVPGLSLITAMAPIYFTGSFGGFEYDNTYIGSTGVDIAVSAVSSYLDILQDSLTTGSFGVLVDSDFNTVVISEVVVKKIYPERTGNEESRVAYDPEGKIVHDRRNQPYLTSDTILQPLSNLANADWMGLSEAVQGVTRGTRDMVQLNITLTGDDSPTEFYVMFDRWEYVADWVLLVLVPSSEVAQAIQVVATTDMSSMQRDLLETKVELVGDMGDVLRGTYYIVNQGRLDVLLTPSLVPGWVFIASNWTGASGFLLESGKSTAIEFDVLTADLSIGAQSSLITFRVQDADYPDCYYSEGLNMELFCFCDPAAA
jgi:hypothetical protein